MIENFSSHNRNIPVQEAVDYFVAQIASCMTGNEYWSAFGYKKRPKHGAVFRKLFPPRKFLKEDFILTDLNDGFFDYWAAERDQYSEILVERGRKVLSQQDLAPIVVAAVVLLGVFRLAGEEGLMLSRSLLSRTISGKNLTGKLATESSRVSLTLLSKQAWKFLSVTKVTV